MVLFFRLIAKPDLYKTKRRDPVIGYTVFYADSKNSGAKHRSVILTSEKHGLTGKPDYVMRNILGGLMPVELKSGSIGKNKMPREGDFMQLLAYFILIEDCFGIRPKKGRLIYSDCMFIVKNTRHHRKMVVRAIGSMKKMLDGEYSPEPNASFMNCRYCLCNGTVCEYAGRTYRRKGESR